MRANKPVPHFRPQSVEVGCSTFNLKSVKLN